jgi:hypothetical protein
MEATGGDSEAVAPSKALLEVRQCFAELDAASAEEAPAQPTQDAAQIIAAVAVGGLSGFVSALQRWHDSPNYPPLEEYSQVADREPRFELGETTLDLLLKFYEMRGTISRLWRGRPPPVSGTLLPLLFQFFGFYRVDFVTSRKQLYLRVLHLKKELKKLSPGDRVTLLHSICFERVEPTALLKLRLKSCHDVAHDVEQPNLPQAPQRKGNIFYITIASFNIISDIFTLSGGHTRPIFRGLA